MNNRCPKCGKEVPTENRDFRPFCSERCKLLDLGKWLSGSYNLPVDEDEEEIEPVPPEDSADS
jgi:endogenous inhibitor of DNA gyrase (YacG/DUF329 family)